MRDCMLFGGMRLIFLGVIGDVVVSMSTMYGCKMSWHPPPKLNEGFQGLFMKE